MIRLLKRCRATTDDSIWSAAVITLPVCWTGPWARIDLSATEALTMLRSIRVVDIDLGNGTTKRAVTAPTPRAAAVLRAIGISDLDPPTPGQTMM
jgi:hypothetical protein